MNESTQLSSLVRGFDRVVRDPVWGDMSFSEAYLALAQTEAFALADRIRQLGPVHMIYPGATHTRKSHSLGVFHVARRLALSLAERGQIDFVGREGMRSFLAAALCHDIGHYPYAHSLKELPLARHEALAADMITSEPLRSAVGACGADPDLTAAIVDGDRLSGEDREILLFRSLLSGVLDPDKIDYLTRDAYFCGVPYGVQDADYILRHVVVGPDDKPGVDGKGVMSVEGLLFSKYLMYRSVYWHPGVRAATSMVRKAVAEALEARIIVASELYGIDDRGFVALAMAKRHPLFAPALAAFSGSLYQPAAEIPFDGENPVHCDLLESDRRKEAEATLAAAAGLPQSDVVVDIPEPVSFEADLAVYAADGVRDFEECDTVFKPDVVARFPRVLRRVRVFVRSPSAEVGRLAAELLS
ncbi:MAG: HD domain-containing protein [Rectinemataceae bacterium]